MTLQQAEKLKVGDVVEYTPNDLYSKAQGCVPEKRKGVISSFFYSADRKRLCIWIAGETEMLCENQIISKIGGR